MSVRQRNYAVIAALCLLLAGVQWAALDRFDTADARAAQAYGFARCNWDARDWPAAVTGLRNVIADYPESQWSVTAAADLVSALMNQGNDTSALHAAEDYADRYRGTAGEPQFWFLQGRCLQRLGRLRDARAPLTWCVEQFPGTQAARDANAVLTVLPPEPAA